MTTLLSSFGIIVHWGIYSVPAYDHVESAKKRKIQNGSEWYFGRLLKTWQINKADILTREYHKKTYGNLLYYDLANKFTAKFFSAKKWIEIIKKLGAGYFIITSKHHDGYCLWPTKTSPFNSYLTGPKKDIIGELAIECKKQNLKFGVYYSILQFDKNMNTEYMKIVEEQLMELIKYKPEIIWFDGDWTMKPNHISIFNTILIKIKNILPSIIINDRLGKNNPIYNNPKLGPNLIVIKDRYMPEKQLKLLNHQQWQYIDTIGLSWGYNKNQNKNDYKSGIEISKLYEKVVKYNGTYLLNIGPDSNGLFSEYEIKC